MGNCVFGGKNDLFPALKASFKDTVHRFMTFLSASLSIRRGRKGLGAELVASARFPRFYLHFSDLHECNVNETVIEVGIFNITRFPRF